MPYFIVETSDALGKKELLAAPEAWVEMKKGKPYLHWPNVRNISSLNTLLADDRSVPSMMWEKHECDILRRNILSLALAAKSIEQLKARAETRASTSKNVPTHKPAAPAATSTKQTKITVGSIAPNPSLSEKVFHIANVDGSANPLSQRETESASTERPSSKMFGDLRDLIDKNQKEMDAKMTQGFQRLHRMLGAIKMRQKEPQNRTDNEMMEEEEEEEAAAAGSTSYGRMSISIEGLDYSPVADYEETDYDSIVAKKSPGTPPTLFMSAEDESE
uniref:Uncharacterized protein n=1 Tax=Anopheles dirus TaxID=7168 RepID=A0A182N3Y8_9DIPT